MVVCILMLNFNTDTKLLMAGYSFKLKSKVTHTECLGIDGA